MTVKFGNYTHSFRVKNKPVFAPTDLGYRIGKDIKARVEAAFDFDPFYHHLQPGGHVASLHGHRKNAYFCKVDIETFFYSVPRNRVVRCLKNLCIKRHVHYAKWSCVKNPLAPPTYSLPYGFVQSPILASLALAKSHLGAFLRQAAETFTVAVYVDDISLSGNELDLLRKAYLELHQAAERSGFRLNAKKSVEPCNALTVFNCSLRGGTTIVTRDRIAEFYEVEREPASIDSFKKYCACVAMGNRRA